MTRSLPVFLSFPYTASILKFSLPVIRSPLTHILNLSLLEGVFPNELKIANVLPLYKADDDMLFNNYRPVSVLSVLSKVFERIMYDRLISFLEWDELEEAYYIFIRKSCPWNRFDHKSKKNVDQWCFTDPILFFHISISFLL